MRSASVLVVAGLCLASCRAREQQGSAPFASADPIAAGSEIDAIDESGARLRFRVDGVEPDPKDRDGDVFLYSLSVRSGDTFEPYCAPDIEGRKAAIPVAGSWDPRGAFRHDSKLVTFACTSGAIAKCIRFGYKPWQSRNGRSLADHHLACMRMVRADYCGDGVSHTRDGTRIDLWDEVGVQNRGEVASEPEVFEAAWGVDGAVYLARPRWSDDVADVVPLCPERLRGHISRELDIPPGEISKRFPEALLFNARFVRDADRMIQR